MSLYICENCGCVDNTALGHYWARLIRDHGDDLGRKALCSSCSPSGGIRHESKMWHGIFPRRMATQEEVARCRASNFVDLPPLASLPTEAEPLTVEAAAIWLDGVIHSLPRPARHHTIIGKLAAEGYPLPIGGVQGFICSDGRFVRREAARFIAETAGQIIEGRDVSKVFTSEALW